MSAQVTAMGIRDGDPAVLQALVNRRGSAVLAYCEAVCAPSTALDAAADAFVRFRAQVLAADRPGDINPEVALLSGTRHAAASRAPRPPAKGGATGLGRLLGGKAPTDRLPDVPNLLADRADGLISPEDDQILEALLDASPVARSIEQRFLTAEEAYRSAPRVALPEPVTGQIVATMGALAAAPTNGGPSAALVEPMSPPDLDDEPLPPPPRFFHTPEPEPDPDPEPEPEPVPEPAPEPEADVPAHDPFAGESVSDPFAAELEDESAPAEPELVEEEPPPSDDDADAAPHDGGATVEWAPEEPEESEEPVDVDAAVPESEEPIDVDAAVPESEEPVDVDAAVPESAEIAATRGEAVDPDGTVEWTVPEDELGESPELEHEIAAARLHDADQDEDPAHLQSASGAVPEDDVSVPPPPAPASPPAPDHHHRHGLPGRAALAPAAAVVAIAAIGAMAASGVFGGNDPSPTVDTGIVPERALQAVPEGEASAVVDDLRAASADARRRRLADQRQQIAAGQATPSPTTEEEPAATPEATPAAPDDEPTTTGETSEPEATTGDEAAPGDEDGPGGGTESP